MKRSSVNFVIDLASFINLLCLVFTGSLIKYVLPPGSGGLGRRLHDGRGGEHIKEFLSMTRHEWGGIHFWFAVAFITLMLIHIILHWSWIKNYFKSLFHLSSRS